MKTGEEAEQLNDIIRQSSPPVFNLLSRKGKAIFFPRKGILSQTAEAAGKRFNATIGIAVEEDGSPMRLSAIADAIALNPKDIFPYAPGPGKPELREAWAEHIRKVNPSLEGVISLPVVTNGLTHALHMAGYLLVEEGDRIITPDKFWENYSLVFEHACSAQLVPFNTFTGSGFDLDSFRETLHASAGKTIVLLNFPNNPAGYTPTEQEADELAAIILAHAEAGNETAVICDDAYFGLVFEEGIFRESLFTRFAQLHEKVLAVKIDGCSKEDFAWGLRVGFITLASKGISKEACTALEAKLAGIVRGSISNVSNLSQSILLKAMESGTYLKEKAEKAEQLRKRYAALHDTLRDPKFAEVLTLLPGNSGYFACMELKPGIDAEKVRQRLLAQYNTGVITSGNTVRIAFSGLPTGRIREMMDNVYKACMDSKE